MARVDEDFGHRLVVVPQVVQREDGEVTLWGAEWDVAGRPVDLWIVNDERELHPGHWAEHHLGSIARLFLFEPGSCESEAAPLRLDHTGFRAGAQKTAMRLRWYPGLDVPAEIWSEIDGWADGGYVALDPLGEPLVWGEHVLGLRHGLWYFFGRAAGSVTLVAIEDYVMGEVVERWRSDGQDTLRTVVDVLEP